MKHIQRRLAATAVGSAAVLAFLVQPASAATSATTAPSSSVATCGGATFTVTTPSAAAQQDATKLGTELGHSTTASPLVRKAAATHARWLTTLSCVARTDHTRRTPTQTQQGATPLTAGTSYTTANWSGYEDSMVSGVYWNEMAWTVPSVSFALYDGRQNQYSSIWPGLGGLDNPDLIQDGTEQDISCATTGCSQSDYFWVEALPTNSSQLEVTNLTPKIGDSVAAVVAWTASTQKVTFTLCDYTQNTCLQGSETTVAPGPAIDWIVERTQVNGSFPALPNFGSVQLTDCIYGTARTDYALTAGTYNSLTMVNRSDVLAQPGSPSGSTFTDYWKSGL